MSSETTRIDGTAPPHPAHEDACGCGHDHHRHDHDHHHHGIAPYVRATLKVGRNDPCPCGSGKKYKKCCLG
jgi:uncharacterized protein YecA (UPF0149 family)